MEAATIIPPQATPLARERDASRYAAWVHVGPGAEECEGIDLGAGTVTCGNPLHFHAWCRLPNQFQHREIREKALGAKARKIRLLRDPQSDAWEVLEEEMNTVARAGEVGKRAIVEQLLQKDWGSLYLDAGRDVAEVEEIGPDGEPVKVYGHVDDDQRRMLELLQMNEADRNQDELAALERHLEAHAKAVEARHQELLAPVKAQLEARDMNSLIDTLREDRIASEGFDEFMHTYSMWSWYEGTLRGQFSDEQVFASVAAMRRAAPEVIHALKEVFDDLERALQQGNS